MVPGIASSSGGGICVGALVDPGKIKSSNQLAMMVPWTANYSSGIYSRKRVTASSSRGGITIGL